MARSLLRSGSAALAPARSGGECGTCKTGLPSWRMSLTHRKARLSRDNLGVDRASREPRTLGIGGDKDHGKWIAVNHTDGQPVLLHAKTGVSGESGENCPARIRNQAISCGPSQGYRDVGKTRECWRWYASLVAPR